jgi:methyl-accepting chemotaxis protein
VQDAGATMHEIVSSVQRVTDVIQGITSAASAQRNDIGQVNGAVRELDEVTQQNAALVEQSAAAAQSLQTQVQRLAELMRGFRLEAGATAVA